MKTYEKSKAASLTAECATDYTLADFEGDIKKILTVSARVVPAGHYLDNNAYKFGGAVIFDVLYVDAEGKLSPLHATGDYEISASADEEKSKGAVANVTVADVTARPYGPRKLGLRAALTGCAEILEEETAAFLPGEGFETEKNALPVYSVTASESTEREYAERSEPLGDLTGAEILLSGGDVFADRAEKKDDGIEIGGNIYLFSLLRGEDGNLFYVKKTVPFSELLRTSEGEAASYDPKGILTSVTATPAAEDGENYLSFSCICEFRVEMTAQTEIPVTTDLYHLDFETETTTGDFSTEKIVFAENGTLSASAASAPPDDCLGMTEVLFGTGHAKVTETKWENDRLKISGEAVVHYVGKTADESGKCGFCHGKISIPFTKEMTVPPTKFDRKPRILCNLYRCDVSWDGEKVTATADIALSVRVIECVLARIVTSAEIRKDSPIRHDAGRVSVYYPDKGETVYGIAKAYHIPVCDLASQNGLAQTAAAGDAFLLPRKLLIKG